MPHLKNNRTIVGLIAHLAAWLCFITLPYLVFVPRFSEFISSLSNHMLATIVCINIFLVLFYYVNTLFLIPKLLVREKWIWYILSIIVCLFIFLYLPRQIATWIAEPEPFNPAVREFIRNPAYKGKPHFVGMMRNRRPGSDSYNTILFLLVFTVGTCISMIQRWLNTEQNRKETENEKLNTELSFLKSQVNPHFFFNTLNNIYSLAVVRSEKTAPAVMKLSAIMRYILTETQRDYVPLSNEVDFIHNFIDLQKVRLTDKVLVKFDTSGNNDSLLVAPLLFIPFVENAFKYGVSTKSSSEIQIRLWTEGNRILFTSDNFIVPSENNLMENTGIGINNVKRRLELMYPDKHKLTTTEKDNHYIVHLEIET
jgi:two-component system LytT family sensor kinase